MKRCLLLLAACGNGVHSHPGDAIDWALQSESLVALEMTLQIDGQIFKGTTNQLVIAPSPQGDVLDVMWEESGHEPHLHFHFATDGTTWWIDDVRAALDNGTPYENMGRFYETAAGKPFEGTLDLTFPMVGLVFTEARLATLGVQ